MKIKFKDFKEFRRELHANGVKQLYIWEYNYSISWYFVLAAFGNKGEVLHFIYQVPKSDSDGERFFLHNFWQMESYKIIDAYVGTEEQRLLPKMIIGDLPDFERDEEAFKRSQETENAG